MNDTTITDVNFSYLSAILKAASRKQLDANELLTEANIPIDILSSSNRSLTVDQYAGLAHLIEHKLDDEAFGCLPNPLRRGTFEICFEHIIHSSHLGEALERMCRYFGVVTDDFSLKLTTSNKTSLLTLNLQSPWIDTNYAIVDTLFFIIHRFCSWAVNCEIQLKSASFHFPKPPPLNRIQPVFNCPCQFNSGQASSLTIQSDYLFLPILKTEKDLANYDFRNAMIFDNGLHNTNSITYQVYRALSAGNFQPLPSCDEVAKTLNLTQQTLRRKLKREGNSFQRIKDILRRDIAIRYISDGELSVTEISQKLDFSTQSAFSRAYKGWTGMSPKASFQQMTSRSLELQT